MSSDNGTPDQTSSISTESDTSDSAERPVCFVIMPVSDPPGYAPGHFERVFEDIFVPACNKAGFDAVRADQVRQTNLIHLDILQKLLDSAMALCDLSSRNPNVLFELGLRQAFDKPVTLVQELGTPQIFDITPLRYTEYHKERIYHEVLQDQARIARAITETKKASESNEGVNSIVKLLSITQPAALIDVQEADKDPVLQLVRAELSELRAEFGEALRARSTSASSSAPREVQARRLLNRSVQAVERLRENLQQIEASGAEPAEQFLLDVRSTKEPVVLARVLSEEVSTRRRLIRLLDELDSMEATYYRLQGESDDFNDIPF